MKPFLCMDGLLESGKNDKFSIAAIYDVGYMISYINVISNATYK